MDRYIAARADTINRRRIPYSAAQLIASAARSRTAPPASLQAAAHGVRDVTPRGKRPLGRQAVLVEDVQEREPICHRDPGIAHPDVEIALVFLIGLLRKLGAFSGHPPRVVGLGSHELPSVCP